MFLSKAVIRGAVPSLRKPPHIMVKHTTTGVACCFLLAAIFATESATAQERPLELQGGEGVPSPNVVLILADDLGYGDLSSYGAGDLQTPNVDQLVADGMRFDQFYANSSVCSPTRAALLTGRYPDVVGVPGVIRTHARNSWGYLDPSATLISTLLRGAGYHTGMVGKWHLGLEPPNVPTVRGFDFFKGYLGDMMDDYFTHRRHGINYMREGREPIDPEGHATELFTKWAQEYIRARTTSDAPFFLYLAYNAPHSPIQPPEAWLKKLKARNPELSKKRAKIAALIEHMDDGIGRVVETLRETGAYENTLIIFTSDNGGKLAFGARNGPLRGSKGGMYEGELRVPMVAVWPGRIVPGSRSQAVAATMDLYPTIAEAAGARVDYRIDARSMLPVFRREVEAMPERPLFFVRREGGSAFMGKVAYAVRWSDWKLVQETPTSPFELYNLSKDLGETRARARENNEEVFDELAETLRLHIQETGEVPWQQ